MKNVEEHNPVLILGMYIPGMFIYKYFSRMGIQVYGLDTQKVIGFYLRGGNSRCQICPDPDVDDKAWLAFMERFTRRFNVKPVVFITSDKFIDCFAKYKDILRQSLIFHESEDNIYSSLGDKKRLYELAIQYGLKLPRTFFPKNLQEAEETSTGIEYPCIIKPLISRHWWQPQLHKLIQWNKVIVVQSKEELLSRFAAIFTYDKNLMLQEVIKGPDDNLHYLVCYIDRGGRCSAYFIGQKIRLTPIHFGHATYVKTVTNERLRDTAVGFLKKINYWGACGMEFKRDARDGEFKLIEVNPRIGLWDSLGVRVGINIADMAYRDLLGEPIKSLMPLEKNNYWAQISSDINAFFEYRSERRISFWQWIKSLFKVNMFGDIYFDEPGVLYYITIKRINKKIRHFFAKYLKKNES